MMDRSRTSSGPRAALYGAHRRGRSWAGPLLAGILLMIASPIRAQVVIGSLDDFQSGTTENWVANLSLGLPPVPPAVVADAGPDGPGDFALRVTATGSPLGAGGKLVVNNVEPRWTGDYPTAGVLGLLVDVNNPNAFPLTIRVGISEPLGVLVGGRWVTQGMVVPAASGWTTLEFSLEPQDLLPGEALASNADATLANVGILRIMHSTTASFAAEAIAAQLDIDNPEAVPEPTTTIGLLSGVIALLGLRGRRRA